MFDEMNRVLDVRECGDRRRCHSMRRRVGGSTLLLSLAALLWAGCGAEYWCMGFELRTDEECQGLANAQGCSRGVALRTPDLRGCKLSGCPALNPGVACRFPTDSGAIGDAGLDARL